MIIRFIIVLVFIALSAAGFSDEKSSIQINIRNYGDSALLMTSYYGDRVILVDTAYAKIPGVFVFENKELLPGGIYMAVSLSKRKLFEFIVNEDQEFTLTTDTLNYSLYMFVKGSEENKLFFDYMKFNDQLFRANTLLKEEMAVVDQGSDHYRQLVNDMDSLNKSASNYKLDIIKEKPDLFIAKMFNAMREVEIPDSITGSSDSSASYRYYKTHYWDYFDLSDARLLRTPMLARKVDQYFSQLVFVQPDSVISAISEIIEMVRPSQEVVSWLSWHFLSVYQNPDYMGFDGVFIYLVDEYFSKEEIDNLTPSILQNLQDRANIMRPLLLGSEAPNLILIDSTGDYQSFLSLTSKYIVLFFWDMECGICKKEISELKELYAGETFDLEIYSISVNSDLEKWKESLVENDFQWMNVNGTRSVTKDFHDLYDLHGTPAIYVLDKNRNIIAKHLSADQIEGFLENYSATK